MSVTNLFTKYHKPSTNCPVQIKSEDVHYLSPDFLKIKNFSPVIFRECDDYRINFSNGEINFYSSDRIYHIFYRFTLEWGDTHIGRSSIVTRSLLNETEVDCSEFYCQSQSRNDEEVFYTDISQSFLIQPNFGDMMYFSSKKFGDLSISLEGFQLIITSY